MTEGGGGQSGGHDTVTPTTARASARPQLGLIKKRETSYSQEVHVHTKMTEQEFLLKSLDFLQPTLKVLS